MRIPIFHCFLLAGIGLWTGCEPTPNLPAAPKDVSDSLARSKALARGDEFIALSSKTGLERFTGLKSPFERIGGGATVPAGDAGQTPAGPDLGAASPQEMLQQAEQLIAATGSMTGPGGQFLAGKGGLYPVGSKITLKNAQKQVIEVRLESITVDYYVLSAGGVKRTCKILGIKSSSVPR